MCLTRIFNDTKNSLKIIRVLYNGVVKFIHNTKPPYFMFTAFEKNRIKLYEKFAKRLELETQYKYKITEDGFFLFI